ncbi:hypothetical protein AWC25_11190 [Mycobacterium sherrisii]|nr:hypothetical protein AWC25_11190 [Mycobacterium sherrisii]
MGVVRNRVSKSVSALCGVAIVAAGVGGVEPSEARAATAFPAVPTGGASAPPASGDGGALPVKPAGGGPGCIVGLNCGPINPPKPPPPRRPPTLGHGPQSAAPAPHTP